MTSRLLRFALRTAIVSATLAIAVRIAFPQAISNPSNPTNNPNQINVTTSYLYLNKLHYAGAWSGSVTYNSQDVVFYSSASYISLQVANLNQNPASASLYWIVIPGSGGGGGTWGSITGTLSSQTDLNTALGLALAKASNLSDLASASTARTNLGLGTAAVATGPAGAIVGTTDTQTLTNKSIAGSEVNSGTIPHAQLPTLLTGDIPNNAANTSGNAASATALASTPSLCSTGSAPTGVLASGNATGCAVLPTAYYSQAQGNTGALNMTGSPVTAWTFTGVPLAAGSCLHFSGVAYAGVDAFTVHILVGATTVSTPITANNAGGYGEVWTSLYCNNPGSQTAQTLTYLSNNYVAPTSSSYANALGLVSDFQEAGQSTPTAVNWTTNQTITVTLTAAGGTATGFFFGIN